MRGTRTAAAVIVALLLAATGCQARGGADAGDKTSAVTTTVTAAAANAVVVTATTGEETNTETTAPVVSQKATLSTVVPENSGRENLNAVSDDGSLQGTLTGSCTRVINGKVGFNLAGRGFIRPGEVDGHPYAIQLWLPNDEFEGTVRFDQANSHGETKAWFWDCTKADTMGMYKLLVTDLITGSSLLFLYQLVFPG